MKCKRIYGSASFSVAATDAGKTMSQIPAVQIPLNYLPDCIFKKI